MTASSAALAAPQSSAAPQANFGKAMFALGVGGFSIGTGEFVIMGLLPEMARDVGIGIPQAGHAISAYALGVVIGAPVLAVLAARLHRRAVLIALILAYAAANFASAMAPGYASLLLLRFASGLPHGTYFGVAALVAASLAPAGKRARAVGLVMLGLSGATLVGVPIATWLGQSFGWRFAFVFVGAIALVAALLLRSAIPHMPAVAGASPWRELGALGRKQVWYTLGIAAIGFGGMFSVFSYIKPTLIEIAGLPLAGMPWILVLFGLGMVAGNLVGSRLADLSVTRTIGGVLLWAVAVLALFPFAAQALWSAAIAVFLLGTLVAIGPALQIRLMDVAGEAQTLAAALNHSAFNAANALGAWLGGLAIAAGFGWTSTGWVGVLLALAGLAVFGAAMASTRADTQPSRG